MSKNAYALPRLNTLVTIEVDGGRDRGSFSSRIENVEDSMLSVAMPSERGALVNLRSGTEVRVLFNVGDDIFLFVAEVVGHRLEPIPVTLLGNAGRVTKIQRRDFLRVSASIFPVEAWVLDSDPEKCRQVRMVVTNISGGGLRVVSSDNFSKGTEIRLRMDLPFECGVVQVVAKVLRTTERGEATNRRYESATVITEITEGDRDRICKFALKQQLEIAKRGLRRR